MVPKYCISCRKITETHYAFSPRWQLQRAVESLDTEQIEHIVTQIGSYDQNSQQVLVKLTENFDYPHILKVLRGN